MAAINGNSVVLRFVTQEYKLYKCIWFRIWGTKIAFAIAWNKDKPQ